MKSRYSRSNGLRVDAFGRPKRTAKNDHIVMYRTAKRAGIIVPGSDNSPKSLAIRYADLKGISLPEGSRRRRFAAVVEWILRNDWDGAAPLSAPVQQAKIPIPKDLKQEFYASWEWRTLRLKVLQEQGRRCQCCGACPGDLTVSGLPVRIVVDHIRPLSKFWELRLERSNLQVLCDECNQGAGAWDQTDYREPPREVMN